MILKFYFSVWKTLYNATVILPIWSCCCSQVKGTELHKFPHFKNTSNNFWGSQVTWTSDQLAKKSGVSIIPSCSLIHCNNAQNSEKHYNYNFITKDTNLNQPMKRCIVIKVWDNPKPKASVPSGRIILCVHQCISPARRLNQGLVSRIFIGISLWRYDRLPPGTQSPGLLPIPGGLANIIWLKVPTI